MRCCTVGFRFRITLSCLALLGGVAGLLSSQAAAQEAQWIWTAAHDYQKAPKASCVFRKTFKMTDPEEGRIDITADDQYEVHVNGQKVGSGDHWRQLDRYDVTKHLVSGNNVIAVLVTNKKESSAGLSVGVTVKNKGGTIVSHSTDATWKASLKAADDWQQLAYDDSQWLAAKALGEIGATLPWGNEVKLAGKNGGRFRVPKQFSVEWVIAPKDSGSLIAMTFNEFGQILASREGGPLLLIIDKDKDGLVETVTTFSDKVKNCQGILALNGSVFVTGDGPDGAAMYRLDDKDRDGKAEAIKTILRFSGEMGEHGIHSLSLGPDGSIYLISGNHSQVKKQPQPTSPYRHAYAGDLVQPRHEDPGGHALGKKAPGGTILRTDAEGSFVEIVAGGLRNAYDMAFNRDGELFTFDSDMEWDTGLPWYRPTRINHVTAGAEFGWRSGWAKWPTYYHDSLDSTLDIGPGSPTGMVAYDHVKYPRRYHDSLFVCDWALGRILHVSLKRDGASYTAKSKVFVEGRPMNVTDIAVSPGGWLYFSTGGRGTEGGIYRVIWNGKIPPSVTNFGTGLTAVIRQPQIDSSWSRQKIALIKQKLGKKWAPGLVRVASDPRNQPKYRTRALNLMQLFGPEPQPKMLVKLSQDRSPIVRSKAAYLMGLHSNDATGVRLSELMGDPDVTVRRAACEALQRAGQVPPAERTLALLRATDRHVAWSARRLLEQTPPEQWRDKVLEAEDNRQFILGSTALLNVVGDQETAEAVLDRTSLLLKKFVTDADFLDLLRLTQLALIKGELKGDDVPALRDQIADEYPSTNAAMNRELVRLVVYMQCESVTKRIIEQLNSEIDDVEKIHIALHAPFLKSGWTANEKMALIKFYEKARKFDGGENLARYIDNGARSLFTSLDEGQRLSLLADGVKHPSTALNVLAALSAQPSETILAALETLDQQLSETKSDTEASRRLKIGIVAVLGRSRDEKAMIYLRKVYATQPARRVTAAIGLAQSPGGENWPVLVESLSIVEGVAAQVVMRSLATVDRAPEEGKSEPLRQAIIRGLMLGENGGQHAVRLLTHWTTEEIAADTETTTEALAAWQFWFSETYVDAPTATLPKETSGSKWTYRELLAHLTSGKTEQADANRGKAVFAKATCAKCHRYGDAGERTGPDLSNVSRRFQKKEILQAIIYPSHMISDQYRTKIVLTKDGRIYRGVLGSGAEGERVMLQANGVRATILEADIESIAPNKLSAMPAGLLDGLSLREVSDLFRYLEQTPPTNITRRPKEGDGAK
jgi:putative heme-binding domain-containing protein